MVGEIAHEAHSPDGFFAPDVPPGVRRNGRLSPKRPSDEVVGLGDIFPYYAGFSFEWAQAKLKSHISNHSVVVLDPWNGSGTTTLAAQSSNLAAIGVDLNPIANLVAQLRAGVASGAHPCPPPPQITQAKRNITDPLGAWLSPATVTRVRQWTAIIDDLPQADSCLLYVSLFRAIRNLTKRFEGSNPTWVRRASTEDELVDVDLHELDQMIVGQQDVILRRIADQQTPTIPAKFIRGTSTKLPFADETIDFLLTSPPYLTRIDYAVAYSRELAITGVDTSVDRGLRHNLMGTTLTRPSSTTSPNYGPLAQDLIRRVTEHPSHASATYYLKQFNQYLDDLLRSLAEVSRIAKNDATMIMVIQDSYYKEVPVRLADICAEEAERLGWKVIASEPFEVSRILTAVNTAAKAYPKSTVAETVLTMMRGSR